MPWDWASGRCYSLEVRGVGNQQGLLGLRYAHRLYNPKAFTYPKGMLATLAMVADDVEV